MQGGQEPEDEAYWTYAEFYGDAANAADGPYRKVQIEKSPDVATHFSLVGLPPSGDFYVAPVLSYKELRNLFLDKVLCVQ